MRFIGKDPNIIDAYYTATAEGAITAGKPIIVEADGEGAQVGFDDASAGAESVFATTSATMGTITYDSSNDKIVVFYVGTSQLRAKVGTVSGDSISFGSEVTVVSRETSQVGVTFDTSNNKFLWSCMKQSGDIPAQRDDHSLAQADGEKFVIFGGFVAGSRVNDTYVGTKNGNEICWK